MKKGTAPIVILTVGNNSQKVLCEKLIARTRALQKLNIHVVTDCDGCRIGSGGAVFSILEKLYTSGSKLIVVNSGGVSKRCINYAVRGKAFTELQSNGNSITLLELILSNALKLSEQFASGTLICCSDILLRTEGLSLDFDDNSGFCIKSDFATGSRHGVMFSDKNGVMTEFLHKETVESLQNHCREHNIPYVPVDTGLVYLTDDFCVKAKAFSKDNNIIASLSANSAELNFYSDIVCLFSKNTSLSSYMSSNDCGIIKKIKELMYNEFSGFPMKTVLLENHQFYHFGSLKECLDNILSFSDAADGVVCINTFTDDASQIGQNTVLNNTHLSKCCKVGSNCLVSDITLIGAEIEDNSSVCGIKLADGSYVTIICPIDENPKNLLNGKELWYVPRFYKGTSFTDSYKKLKNGCGETMLSLADCIEQADYNYYFEIKACLSDISGYNPSEKLSVYREKILFEHFNNHSPLAEIVCKKEKIDLSLPVRVNLSGTWTDAMPYCVEKGGRVINMAVKVNGDFPIRVSAEKLNAPVIIFESDGKETFYDFNNSFFDDFSDFILHKAVLQILGINEKTVLKNGFKLSATVSGLNKGSGLGISSILLGGCIKALSSLLGIAYSENEIVYMIFVAEQLMKTGGGWQDQIGGLLSGIKDSSSQPGIYQQIEVQYLSVSRKFADFVKNRCVLIPSGQRHFGRFIVTDVANRYLENNKVALNAYKEISALNNSVRQSIENDDFTLFAKCLNTHFDCLRRISPKTTEFINKLAVSCLDFADGISVCGAGGGGYLLAVLKEGASIAQLQSFLDENYPSIASSVLNIDISI